MACMDYIYLKITSLLILWWLFLIPLLAGAIKQTVSEIPKLLLENTSAMLFVASKVSYLAFLLQWKAETTRRVQAMVVKIGEYGFVICTNTEASKTKCPKEILIGNIAQMNREFLGVKIGAN